MLDQITTHFFQNKEGRIAAKVEGWQENSHFERLVLNVESFHYSPEQLYMLALLGFNNFND